MTSFNTSFTVAVAFIREETKPYYYRWSLDHVADLYGQSSMAITITTDRELALMNALPHKNVLANCKKYFSTAEDWKKFENAWTSVIQSASLDQFNAQWTALRQMYGAIPAILEYLKTRWISYKERFVSAWTNQVTHLAMSAPREQRDNIQC
ncbi:hypothetical protein PsorP6_006200 [Peronosclerospora sorghi]|uniref:Uncharacterized protein n=1 Tax=Peronosclerospora sorghi TaxID=230839 RepID=A0ACC0W3V0_9STRA|nr:hypothetical protein PsorP6_006200 [Peronosclerospora sorghi]